MFFFSSSEGFRGKCVYMQKYVCLTGVRNDTVRFIVMGDWGGLPDFPYRTPVEKAVGGEMGKIADYLDIQFVLALGDNFYFDGIKDVDDPRFKVINTNLVLN